MTDGVKKRGFAAMDPAAVSAIASRGGKAAHAQGRAYEFDSESARAAGRKGGKVSRQRAKERQSQAAGEPEGQPEGQSPEESKEAGE